MKTIKEMLEERATLVNNARAILDKAKDEHRDATAEENKQFDGLMNQAAKLKADVEAAQQAQQRQSLLESELASLDQPQPRAADSIRSNRADPGTGPELRTIEIRQGQQVECDGSRDTPEYQKNFRSVLQRGRYAPLEARAGLQADKDSKGGFLVPIQWAAQLIQDLDNLLFMRRICQMLPMITGQSLGLPTLDTDIGDPTWTDELGTGAEDSSMAFGKREFKTRPLARRIKVSNTLRRVSAIPIDALVRERMSFKFGAVMEYNYLLGAGATGPLGVFVASDNGISTSRDVSTDNTATEIRFDNLKAVKYSIKQQYRTNLQWIFHRDAVLQVSKLKDGDGHYIWIPTVVGNEPDRLLGYPVNESEYAPSTFSASQYVGVLGNFRYYWIADALEMSLQVLDELYAETNQTGYIARMEGDGAPVDQNAFARVKLGT